MGTDRLRTRDLKAGLRSFGKRSVCLVGSGLVHLQVHGGGVDESKKEKKRRWLRMVSRRRARVRTGKDLTVFAGMRLDDEFV